jgi:hypothetical protein
MSKAESATLLWGRDGAYSVPLPNGKDFWIFGDTPRYDLRGEKWYMTAFIAGTTAGIVPYRLGYPPAQRFRELWPAQSAPENALPRHFIKNPKLYMPDGSGRPCTKKVAGPTTQHVRWPTGAVLMPDRTNIFISYLGNCGYRKYYNIQSWGFILYNWKTNKFTTPPIDVYPSTKSGRILPSRYNFGSPVLHGNKITVYSYDSSNLYSATVPANLGALRKRSSYQPKPLGVAPIYPFSVHQPSKTQPRFTMYQLTDYRGGYRLYESRAPTGPWVTIGSGVLPGCDTSPHYCFTVALHPELSKKDRILASYYLPGYTPSGSAVHPVNVEYFGHVVLAYLPT